MQIAGRDVLGEGIKRDAKRRHQTGDEQNKSQEPGAKLVTTQVQARLS